MPYQRVCWQSPRPRRLNCCFLLCLSAHCVWVDVARLLYLTEYWQVHQRHIKTYA